jgi:ketosteroid isomerase-like protein
MNLEQNKQIAHRAFDALMAGDLTPLGDLLAPDAVLHQCGFLHAIPAHSILSGEFPGRSLVEDRHVQLEQIIGEGDLVALHWRTTGRYHDPASPELDGTETSFPSMTFIRVEAGKIAEIWNIQDTATMHAQLHSAAEPVGTG